MNLELTEQQKIFRNAVQQFALTEISPLTDRAEKEERLPVGIFPKLGELGYLCVKYPTEYGAAGLGEIEECIEMEELGRVSHGIGSSVMVHCGIATSAIKDHGNDGLKEEYLRMAVRGALIASFGLTEPNAGSDVLSIETTARKKGNKYILNGTKIYITNGSVCDFATVAAYTDKSKGRRGISLFVVDKNAPGFSRVKLHKFCLRSSDTAELIFADCEIPEENLIGEEGEGFRYLMETLDVGRISHAASRLGAAEAVLDLAIEYARQRVQFGRPIGSNQAIAFKLARMAMAVESARWMIFRAAWLFDANQPCTKEASMAKLLTSEAYQTVALEAMQIHGGAAALEESVINRHYRDSFVGKVTEGSSEIQELVIARQLGLEGVK